MQHIKNIFCLPLAVICILIASCSGNEDVIPKNTMAKIVSDMYLADQYIENVPEYRAQMDTLLLYEAVAQRYGHSYEEYTNSVKYYLQEGDALKKIHLKAKSILIKERENVNNLIRIEEGLLKTYWAIDSIKTKSINNLWKEPYLRNIKWLTYPNKIDTPKGWRFTDTATFDIPQNTLWWINNIRLSYTNYADSLYPILIRDYTLALENSLQSRNSLQKGKKSSANIDSHAKRKAIKKPRKISNRNAAAPIREIDGVNHRENPDYHEEKKDKQ